MAGIVDDFVVDIVCAQVFGILSDPVYLQWSRVHGTQVSTSNKRNLKMFLKQSVDAKKEKLIFYILSEQFPPNFFS